MSQDLLTTSEVAKMLRVSVATVARWASLGQIPAIRLPSGQLRFRRSDIEKILQQDQPE